MAIPSGWWIDILDIAIVTFLFYKLFQLIRGTRAAQMLFGLIIIIAGSLVAELLRFDALNWLISSLKTVWVVAFVIIFQPELRRVLAQMGQSRFVRYFVRSQHLAVRDEVARAAGELSYKKTGALIVIGREASLRQYIETGTRINAKVTAELISTIFTPQTPLHDGACIIEREELVAAGCILPLSDNPVLPASLGMRHRAAIGLTEETDAVVVVVSGETGGISVAVRGNLRKQLDTESLREVLEEVMAP
ncbi:MAG: diadenylate cyclase CdaA [bacterium]